MEAVRSAKIAEVLGNPMTTSGSSQFKDGGGSGQARGGPRRSASKDRVRPRPESADVSNVQYEKHASPGGQGGFGGGDEVSIGVEWSGDGVSTSASKNEKASHVIMNPSL